MSEAVVISGTGLYQPPHIITNAELVASFNAYVYPPLVAFASIPFTVLPAGVASGLAVALTGIVLLPA